MMDKRSLAKPPGVNDLLSPARINSSLCYALTNVLTQDKDSINQNHFFFERKLTLDRQEHSNFGVYRESVPTFTKFPDLQ